MTYVPSGYKWGEAEWGTASGEVFWTVSSWSGLSYDTGSYSQADFQTSLQDAFDAWENVAAIDFTYTTNASLADMDVYMMSLAGSTVGEAYITFSGYNDPGYIIDSDIRFDSDEYWAPYGETDLSFYAVALHEIGHAIGLDHTDTDPNQIMYPSIAALNTLGTGDIAGAQAIYGLDEGDEAVEVPEPEPEPEPEASPGSPGIGILALVLGLLAIIVGSPAALLAAFSKGPEDENDEVTETELDGPSLGDVVHQTGVWNEEGFWEDTHIFVEGDFDHEHDEDLLGFM